MHEVVPGRTPPVRKSKARQKELKQDVSWYLQAGTQHALGNGYIPSASRGRFTPVARRVTAARNVPGALERNAYGFRPDRDPYEVAEGCRAREP